MLPSSYCPGVMSRICKKTEACFKSKKLTQATCGAITKLKYVYGSPRIQAMDTLGGR